MKQQEFNQLIQTNIITELGLESLPSEKKAALLDKLAELVEKRVVVRILKGLSGADIKSYEKMAVQPDGQVQFLAKKVPNFIDLVQEELVEVKKELLNEVLSDKNLV